MKRLSSCALLAIVAVVSQGQVEVKFDPLEWVENSNYVSRLNLTDAQKALIALPEELRMIWKSKDDPVKERNAWLERAYVRLAESLSTEQLDILFAAHVLKLGQRAFLDAELCERMGLSDEQTTFIHRALVRPQREFRYLEQIPYDNSPKTEREQLEINVWRAERDAENSQIVIDWVLETWKTIRDAMSPEQWQVYLDLRSNPIVSRSPSFDAKMRTILSMSKTAQSLLGLGDDFEQKWYAASREYNKTRGPDDPPLRQIDLLHGEQTELLKRITFQVLGESAAFHKEVKGELDITVWQEILASIPGSGAKANLLQRQDALRTLFVSELPAADSSEYRQFYMTRMWINSIMRSSRRIRLAGRGNLHLRDILTAEQREQLREMCGEPIAKIWKIRAELERIQFAFGGGQAGGSVGVAR